MCEVDELKSTLRALADLLDRHGERRWSASFLELDSRIPSKVSSEDAHEIAFELRKYGGGMGSFNDLILHQAGRPLTTENDELERLRTRLFEIESDLRLAK